MQIDWVRKVNCCLIQKLILIYFCLPTLLGAVALLFVNVNIAIVQILQVPRCVSRFVCDGRNSHHSGCNVLPEVACVRYGVEALHPDGCHWHNSWDSVWYCQPHSFTSAASEACIAPCKHWSVQCTRGKLFVSCSSDTI